jgi:hypothetical protein
MAVTGEHVGALSRLTLGDGEHCSVQRLEQKIEGVVVSRDGGRYRIARLQAIRLFRLATVLAKPPMPALRVR